MPHPEPTIPSLRALTASDHRILSEERRIATTRRQIALVRTVADELERCLLQRVAGPRTEGIRQQLLEELVRLANRALQIAGGTEPVEESGVHPVFIRR